MSFRNLIFFAFPLLILASRSAGAVPPPLPLSELCKNSDLIVLGKYVGGSVDKPKGCEFWVTFQVHPEKYFKKPAQWEEITKIAFKKRYFVDTQGCANIPGPNAMPGQMEEDLKKPDSVKKLFFFQSKGGEIAELTDIFWAIEQWDNLPENWHKEFKSIPACQGN